MRSLLDILNDEDSDIVEIEKEASIFSLDSLEKTGSYLTALATPDDDIDLELKNAILKDFLSTEKIAGVDLNSSANGDILRTIAEKFYKGKLNND